MRTSQVGAVGRATATFIIDLEEQLWLADRHSEHVVCAAGKPVLAAGELVFGLSGGRVWVVEATNQSTGYCPQPECWGVVASTLDRLGIEHPTAFTAVFIFRRCTTCRTINIVKDGVFECAVCQADLSTAWNFRQDER
jgi:hypothetical protein